ncbi:MAG: nucleotidyltransferase domain-containing protein [bacterium]
MLELLFSSSARVKVLTLFVLNSDRLFYQREISSLTRLPIQAVQRELLRLERFGLVQKRIEGKKILYRVDRAFFLYPELKSLILKTSGLGNLLKEEIKDNKEIELAFIYGSYAGNSEDTQSDIDLFVAGGISGKKLSSILRKVQDITLREINYVIFSGREMKQKIKEGNSFLVNVMRGPKIILKGDINDFQ